jgi:cyanobactin maturation PatA/PatG family protease
MKGSTRIVLVGLPELQTETLGDPAITIAVLDGPVDVTHPCFVGVNLTQLETLVTGKASSGGFASAHGTHIASVLFGQPGSEVQGIAPRCCGLLLPIFADRGDRAGISCSQVDLARAITQAVAAGAQVINISGGEITPAGVATPLLSRAVRLCADNNILIVAAAGNEGCECLHVPAALPLVLAVGAMDARGQPLDFSNWGATYQTQGVLAPGESILGATPGGGTATRSGTSFATAVVSGIVGPLLSLQIKLGQPPDPHAVRDLLLNTATACDPATVMSCGRFLRGQLNLAGAQTAVMGEVATAIRPDARAQTTISEVNQPPAICALSTEHTQMRRSKLVSDLNPVDEEQAVVSQTVPGPTGTPVGTATCAPPAVMPGEVYPKQGDSDAPVFAMGTLGYDFGSDARRDWFAERLNVRAGVVPENQTALLDYFATGLRPKGQEVSRAYAAASIIWTLNLEATPIYAIVPEGPFAADVYGTLRDYLGSQLEADEAAVARAIAREQAVKAGTATVTPGITRAVGEEQAVRDSTRVSVPGLLRGSVTLRSGQVVPLIVPEFRGMAQVRAIAPPTTVTSQPTPTTMTATAIPGDQEALDQFMARLFYELRNLGITPQDRAINAMATYGSIAIREALQQGRYEIESIRVEKTPVCRPGSDCWDVIITAFDPANAFQAAKTVLRQTLDVSDVVPVRLGRVRVFSTL